MPDSEDSEATVKINPAALAGSGTPVPPPPPSGPAAAPPAKPRRLTWRQGVAALGVLAAVAVAFALVARHGFGGTTGTDRPRPAAAASGAGAPGPGGSAAPTTAASTRANPAAGPRVPPAPGPPGQPAPTTAGPPADTTGRVQLSTDSSGGEAVDLETGATQRTPANDPHLDLSAERGGLVAVNGTAIAPWPGSQAPTRADCGDGLTWTGVIGGTQLAPGGRYCVRTGTGRAGHLVVDDATVANDGVLDVVAFRYTLWA